MSAGSTPVVDGFGYVSRIGIADVGCRREILRKI